MYLNDNAGQALYAHGLKKTILSLSLAMAMGGIATQASAALPANAVLVFTNGAKVCVYGTTSTGACKFGVTNTTGSFFSMDADGNGNVVDSERTPIERQSGMKIETAQSATGSHGGTPNGAESPGIDKPWAYFSNTGMHFTATAPTVTVDNGTSMTLDFSGWSVTWNGIPRINMGGGTQNCGTSTDGICVDNFSVDLAGTYNNGSGLATLTCGTDCSEGDTFTLNYAAVVPQADPSNFGGVNYTVYLTGTIGKEGDPPVLADDPNIVTIASNPVDIAVTDNDSSIDDFDFDSVAVVSPPSNGTTDDTDPSGIITYTPNAAYTGGDSFTYTVNSAIGVPAANAATVTVDVQTNVSPVANDDTLATGTAQMVSPQTVDVLANDTDANNLKGQPGGLNPASLTITSSPSVGVCTANANGTITYSQTTPTAVVTSCDYEVSDIDTVNTPFTVSATLNIEITATQSDWPTSLDPSIIPILVFEPGVKGDPTDSSVPPLSGSYFTMQVTPTTLIYTVNAPGPDGGMIIGYDQPATGSHTGAPNGTSEVPGFTAPWSFFSNTGFDFTRNGGITGNPDGTLEFNNRYVVTWNGIPEINLGGSSQWPDDLGFAIITCSPAPCEDMSSFSLEYSAHVEDIAGRPSSGFNNVPYGLYLEGTVRFLDGTPKVDNGTVSSITRLSVDEVNADPDADMQCIGGCFDYTVTGVTGNVSIVLPLSGGVRESSTWRIYDGGWRDFDTSSGDTVMSADYVSGAGGLSCPDAGDAAYHALTVGDKCVQLRIADNGPNDLDGTTGTVSDPGGLALVAPPPPALAKSGSSGCSVTNAETNPLQRGEWWLLSGFLAWLGWNRLKRKQS